MSRWAGLGPWDIATCTFSGADGDGFLEVQVDTFGAQDGGTASYELHHPFGFSSRPLDPDTSGGCQVLFAREGSRGHAWLASDPRMAKRLPLLKSGSSMQYCGKGGFGLFNGDDDTYTLYVPTDFDGNGVPTKAHLVTVGKDKGGKRTLALLHADGMALTMMEGGKRSIVIKNAASDAYIEVNDDGIVLNGKLTTVGGTSALPAPGAPAVPVALAPPLLAYLESLHAAIVAIAVHLNAPGPVVGAPGAVPPVPAPPPAIAAVALKG